MVNISDIYTENQILINDSMTLSELKTAIRELKESGEIDGHVWIPAAYVDDKNWNSRILFCNVNARDKIFECIPQVERHFQTKLPESDVLNPYYLPFEHVAIFCAKYASDDQIC